MTCRIIISLLLIGATCVLTRAAPANNSTQPGQVFPTAPGAGNLEPCEELIPGVERMACGIDITKLDLFPSNILQDFGFRKQTIEFSCNKRKKWSHANIANTLFNRPDQINSIFSVPAGSRHVSNTFSQDMDEFKRSQLLTLGFEVDVPIYGSFSASGSYKAAQEQLLSTNRSVAEISSTVSSVSVEFKSASNLPLSEEFQDFIQSKLFLKTYAFFSDVFDEFVQTFGTHYFETAILGGYLQQKTTIENSYLLQSDEREVKLNMEASIASRFKVNVGGEDGAKSVSSRFRQNSESHFAYYGGVADFQTRSAGQLFEIAPKSGDDNFMTKWVPTVNRDPWLLAGKLKPLENLVRDTSLREQVRIAIKIHRTRAYLADLKHSISLGQFSLTQQDKTTLQNVEKTLKAKQITELDKLVKDIDSLFVKIQNIRDKALADQVFETLRSSQTAFYKFNLAGDCLKGELVKYERQTDEHDKVLNSYKPNRETWKHDDFKRFIRESRRLIQMHEYSEQDMCRDDMTCQKCIVRSTTEKEFTGVTSSELQKMLDRYKKNTDNGGNGGKIIVQD